MAEPNPHRQIARTVAFLCYLLTGCVLLMGAIATILAAIVDPSIPQVIPILNKPAVKMTNLQMAIMVLSWFVSVALMIALCGWRIQSLFGREHRQEKLVAKSAVGCLRLGGLGCVLWVVPGLLPIFMTGKILTTGEPAGFKEALIVSPAFVIPIVLMLSIAWFISATFLRLTLEEGRRAYRTYLDRVQPRLAGLADPATRAYVQEQTLDVLTKLDTTLKRALLDYLSESGVLNGDTRIVLHGADFRRVDLRTISLPHADLRETNLEDANLQGAFLFEANLHKATLKRADLSRANLQGADLQQADLTDAVLDGAKLIGANLTGTIVAPHQLQQARRER